MDGTSAISDTSFSASESHDSICKESLGPSGDNATSHIARDVAECGHTWRRNVAIGPGNLSMCIYPGERVRGSHEYH